MIRFAVLMMLGGGGLIAQSLADENFHGWFSYIGDHPLGKSRWGVHLEEQWRRHDGILRWQQNLPRAGVNFAVSKSLTLGAGYGWITTYRYGESPVGRSFPESRLWYDVRHSVRAGKFTVANRVRFENRWLEFRAREWSYENRVRHLLRVTHPLRGAWYAGVYDEWFLPVKPERNPNALDQNRAAAVVGRALGAYWRVEAGYMHQAVWQRNARWREDNHTLVFTVTSSKPFFR